MKHAYLIMAHEQIELLKLLIEHIDDERNDIYLHVDKKFTEFNLKDIKILTKKSKLILVKQIDVRWGGHSQIVCEIELLKSAVNSRQKYSYYHLISGVDIPLKTQNHIHQFFKDNKGKEFVHFVGKVDSGVKKRFNYYHFLQNYIGKGKGFLYYVENALVRLQAFLRMERSRNDDKEYYWGSNWFSITNDLAEYIVSKEYSILKTFKHTLCCDEVFMQTMIVNTHFYNSLYSYDDVVESSMRFIDWKRGNPYVFTKNEDIKELMETDCLFARKFDYKENPSIVKEIYSLLNSIKSESERKI